MRRRRDRGLRLSLAVVVALVLGEAAHGGMALGTAFTYQGQLRRDGAPVNGPCDFEFRLWDAATAGAQVGATQSVTGHAVTNGLFTVQLDFGQDAFDGNARWLEIAVKGPGEPGHTTLSPRQPLTPAPYALALPGLRTQQNATSPNILAGYTGNSVGAGVHGAVVGGGGENTKLNRVTDHFGTVGGGVGNQSGDDTASPDDAEHATVGGGDRNRASGQLAAVGGGYRNAATGAAATVAGGSRNAASADYATASGGAVNVASGSWATIGGGYNNAVSGASAVVGGGASNAADGEYATVAGGAVNQASADRATVGGGYGNKATDQHATVGGGNSNTARGACAAVGGGRDNTASGDGASVAGGTANTANGHDAAIGGGYSNTASGIRAAISGGVDNTAGGYAASIPGGYHCTAGADFTFAAGRRAKASHQGAFVWADSSDFDFASNRADIFRARATGGVRFVTAIDGTGAATAGPWLDAGDNTWNTPCDRTLKENFQAVDGRDVLARVVALPITTWNAKSQSPDIRHMGPVAQDFHAAFGLGSSDKAIATVDADGVALAAIQGLHQIAGEKDAEIADLKARLAKLEALVAGMAAPAEASEREGD